MKRSLLYSCLLLPLLLGSASAQSAQEESSEKKASDKKSSEDMESIPLKGIEGKEVLGPDLVDLDGDGKLDIVAGTYGGTFLFYRNTGTKENPSFAKPTKLQAGGKDLKLNHW